MLQPCMLPFVPKENRISAAGSLTEMDLDFDDLDSSLAFNGNSTVGNGNNLMAMQAAVTQVNVSDACRANAGYGTLPISSSSSNVGPAAASQWSMPNADGGGSSNAPVTYDNASSTFPNPMPNAGSANNHHNAQSVCAAAPVSSFANASDLLSCAQSLSNYSSHEMLTCLSFKMYSCTPAELPETVLRDLMGVSHKDA